MAANPQMTDIDAVETQEWIDSLQSVIDRDGIGRAHFLLTSLMNHARRERSEPAVLGQYPYINTIPESRSKDTPGDAANRVAYPFAHSVERAGDGGAGKSTLQRARRPHRELRLRRDALRRRLQPLLARAERDARRRPDLHAGPLRTRHLRPRLPRRSHHRGPPAQVPPGDRRRGALLLPAPVADARLLAVSDGVDGARPHHGHLPGAVHEVPAQPGAARHLAAEGVGVHGRRGDGRARRRSERSRWRRARSSTTSSSSSTATFSASTARCAATEKSSRSWRRRSAGRAGTC